MTKEAKNTSLREGMTLVNTALTAVKTTVQSVLAMEPLVAKAALYAVEHANQHGGDVSLADKLMKGLHGEVIGKGKSHPVLQVMYNELLAWFRANSPIRWDAKGKCTIDKERGWKDKDIEHAREKAFNETDRAIAARDIAIQAGKKALEPATGEMALARLKGIIRWYQSLSKPNSDGETRGIARGEGPKIRAVVDSVEELVKELESPQEKAEKKTQERGRSTVKKAA